MKTSQTISIIFILAAALAYFVYKDLKRPTKAGKFSLSGQPNLWFHLPEPCSKKDPWYQVFTVPTLGKFCLEKVGVDAIKSILRKGRVWEASQKKIFEKYVRKGTVVLDIGAHIGSHTLTLSKLAGPKGQVHSFEPQLKIYQELLKNMDLNKIQNVYTHFVALGDRHMRVSMDSPVSKNEGGTPVGRGGNRVELRTLDSYQFRNVSFIKCDAEGSEEMILKGAQETLKRNQPVLLIEILHHTPKYLQAAKRIFAALKKLGYNKFKKLRSGHNYLALPKHMKAD